MALPPRKGAAREESFLPKAPRRCLPPLGLSVYLISWRMGLLGLVPLAHIGQGAPRSHLRRNKIISRRDKIKIPKKGG